MGVRKWWRRESLREARHHLRYVKRIVLKRQMKVWGRYKEPTGPANPPPRKDEVSQRPKEGP